MSIPGISSGPVGAGVLSGISIPGVSIPGIWSGAGGAGVLPDMSIPDMSIPGIWSGAVGVAMLSNGTPAGAVATSPAAEASWCEVSMSDPTTAIPATVRLTDATRNGRHRRAA
jgi:hypothetical protein